MAPFQVPDYGSTSKETEEDGDWEVLLSPDEHAPSSTITYQGPTLMPLPDKGDLVPISDNE